MIRRIFLFSVIFLAVQVKAQVDSVSANTAILHADSVGGLKDTSGAANLFNIPIFSTSDGDAEGDVEQQDVSSLLMSSRDVFTQFASFQFGAARYRMRGYPAENQDVMINGVNVNNLETGFSSWSNWGGLNDVTRYVENRFGVVANRMGFSGAGGYTNIDSKASSFRKGTRFSYAFSNRIYAHRLMLTHSTGMLKSGWAITVSASSRNGDQVYIPGTYFDAKAYYASIDKRLNDKHLISFTGFGAPIEQGRASAATLETYEIAGSNYYNSYWGYQNGKVRNSNVSKTHRPMLMLSHFFSISPESKLSTTVFYNFGKLGVTSISRDSDAPNQRPDYYRYLPSFYYLQGDTANGDIVRDKWLNNTEDIRQINWDRMISMNRANLYSTGGLNSSETRARYIVEDRVENLSNLGFNTVYNKRMNKIFLSVGLNGNIYKSRKYKVLEDLLGASWWLDVDQFADNLGADPMIIQNDIDNPNRKVKQGEEFGYNYSININSGEIWGQAEYSMGSLDLYAGLSLSSSTVWREGYMANGKFPTSSKGLSDKVNFFNYGVKGGATYKVTGRHFLTANLAYLTRTPEVNSIFVAPRVRRDIVEGIESEKVFSGDINYIVKYPNTKLRLTYYYTQINDQTWLRTYYHDTYNNNVNLIMKGLNQNHQGVELGVEQKLFISHVIQGALGYGQFLYTNRPTMEAWQDNNSTNLFKDRTVYLKNYRVGGSPQFVAGLGYKYEGRKFWFAGIYFNYFDQLYIDANPDRRTAEAVEKYISTETDAYHAIIDQEKLPSYFTLNANAGKSFRILKKYYLRLNGSVNNILNNRKIINSGYEQLRWDYTNVSQFDNKYYYMPGIQYMVMVNFSF